MQARKNGSNGVGLDAVDLALVLALQRGGTLAAAAERLGVDASTVFRSLQRLERGLGARLFERTRSGYQPADLALVLAAEGERVEAALEAARSAAQADPGEVSGTVRITTTDTLLHALVAPALVALARQHPALAFDLAASNELASLTRRDADLAVRATSRPPPHLVGQPLGPVDIALYARKGGPVKHASQVEDEGVDWIAPDDALPEHPSVRWRRRHHPKVVPRWRVNSLQTVLACIERGLGVGVLPMFLAEGNAKLRRLDGPFEDARTGLWLLAHPDTRHLQRISVTYAHLARTVRLDGDR